MSASQDKQLIMASAHLARSSPEAWNNFILAMSTYAAGWKDQLLMSPADKFQTNQGSAREAGRLAELFKDAPHVAEKIERRA